MNNASCHAHTPLSSRPEISSVWPWFNPSHYLSFLTLWWARIDSFSRITHKKIRLFGGIGTISPPHSMYAVMFSSCSYFLNLRTVQLFLLILFTSKCLCTEVIGSPTLSAEVISRFKSKKNEEKNNISPVRSLFYILHRLVSKMIPKQGASCMKHVVVKIG